MLGGPCGGQPGALPRGGKAYGKGGFPSKRKMPLKGLRKGGYISVVYREKKNPGMIDETVQYEGKIIDKRVGWDNRESYVELEDCIRVNVEGEIVAKVGTKKLFDAFIEECEECEKVERQLCAELRPAASSNQATGMQSMMEAMMPGMMAGMSGGGMMPAMAMGGMPMGMMPMGMGGMVGMGMGMGGMGMGGMPMGMMGMPMMGMMPMQMGMMPMGMMGGMPAMAGGMGCNTMGSGDGGFCGMAGTTPGSSMGAGAGQASGSMPSAQLGSPTVDCPPGVQVSAPVRNRSRSRSRGR